MTSTTGRECLVSFQGSFNPFPCAGTVRIPQAFCGGELGEFFFYAICITDRVELVNDIGEDLSFPRLGVDPAAKELQERSGENRPPLDP